LQFESFFLVLDKLLIFLNRVFAQIFKVLVDIDRLSVQLRNYFLQKVKSFSKLGVLLPDLLLELTVLISNVLNKLAKLLIVEDHPQDDGFVDIDRGKFVRVALIDNLSDFREMFRDFWSTLLDY